MCIGSNVNHKHVYIRIHTACRGSRKSYYDGAFIADNQDVDDHLALIGYCDDSSSVSH